MRRTGMLPVIAVLATGGTIAGRARVPGSVTAYEPGVLDAAALLAALPALGAVAEIRCAQVANIGSEHMTEAVWKALAEKIADVLETGGVDGIVVLHGTDTMEETAFFLDCLFGGMTEVPLVLTGAMRPADAVSADGPGNMLDAVRAAADPAAGGRGALVVFANRIHEAARVYKADTLALDAFRSGGGGGGGGGGGAAGAVVDGEVRFHGAWGGGEWPDFGFAPGEVPALPEAGIVYGHAGMREETVRAVIDAAAWEGIVYAGAGMGNIHAAARGPLREAAERGVVVVRSTRVAGGTAAAHAAGEGDGFLCAHGLNPQKARVLLQLALAARRDRGRIQDWFDLYR